MEVLNSLLLNQQSKVDTLSRKEESGFEKTKEKQFYDNTEEKHIESSSEYIDNNEINKVAQAINDYLKLIRRDLQVEIHKETHTPIFKVVRTNDKKVLCEIPPRELLNIAVKIKDMVGSFVDHNA